MVDTVSSGSCPILFKFITLQVAIYIVCLPFSNIFLSSIADFSNTATRKYIYTILNYEHSLHNPDSNHKPEMYVI